MDGVIKDLQELTGHKTTSMTCRYAQLATSLKLAAVARLVVIQADQGTPSDITSYTGAIRV
jgi:hypothetical protein